jgi:hypothetical protein
VDSLENYQKTTVIRNTVVGLSTWTGWRRCWCGRGLEQSWIDEQRWIGEDNTGRHVASHRRKCQWHFPRRTPVAAFIGEKGLGRRAAKCAIGPRCQ